MAGLEKVAYQGWENCLRISNSIIELIVTTEVGPRIMFFGFKKGENVFFNNPAEAGLTGGEKWRSYGGHRFWHAPEDIVRTYQPDNLPVQVEELKNGARFIANVESCGVQKTIEVQISDNEPKVKVNHILTNLNQWTISLAPWALSVMKAGGKVIVPHPPKIAHDDRLIPTHTLTLWGFTDMDDPRWTWGRKYYFLRQDKSRSNPQKIGSVNTDGWAAYLNGGILFVKKFPYDPKATYTDLNCNFETYTDANMLEIETLGPFVQIEPGKKIEHLEEWSLYQGVKDVNNDVDVDQHVLPLIK